MKAAFELARLYICVRLNAILTKRMDKEDNKDHLLSECVAKNRNGFLIEDIMMNCRHSNSDYKPGKLRIPILVF